MSIDQLVCDAARERWHDLGLSGRPDQDLVFMKVQGKLSRNASVVALLFDAGNHEPAAVVKIPRNPDCSISVEKEYAAMQALQPLVSSWDGAGRIPHQGFVEEIRGARILFQKAMSGHSLVREMVGPAAVAQVCQSVLPWAVDLYRQTAREAVLDGACLDDLIRKPVRLFLDKIGNYPEIVVPEALQQYLNAACDDLSGEKASLVTQHGDFNAHNILVNDRNTGVLDFSVIDWEDFDSGQLPIHDVSHFFISNSKLIEMGLTAEGAFSRHVIEGGWYQDLFIDAVRNLERAGLISEELFWRLVPIYFIGMCLRLMEAQRQQEHTLGDWVSRADEYIKRFPLLKR